MATKKNSSDNQLVVAKDILPEVLSIIPLSQRPIFPGMMIPLVLTGEMMITIASDIMESDTKIGGVVLIEHHHEGRLDSSDLYTTGVAIKIFKVTPIDENTVQVMINALGRFNLKEVVQEKPLMKWKVEHYFEEEYRPTEEMKAYSLAIITSVKDLIKSNSLFQEELKLFLNRFSVEDPGKLSDFVASMTTADAREIQEVLETFNVRERVEKVLALLKKEIELSKLQKKISKQIEERMSKQQKEFFFEGTAQGDQTRTRA